MIEVPSPSTNHKKQSTKALIVLFIVASVIANGGFIALLLKRYGRRVITQAKICILLSLALGSILHALFADMIFAIVYYEATSMDCTLFVLASNWKENFIPLVYGCGLFLLCVDSIFRSDSAFCINSRIHRSVKYSIFCVTLPWLLGIVVSCPLTLSDVEFEKHCDFKQSVTKEVVVQCVIGILPAICCVLASFTAWLFQECRSDDDFQQRIDNYFRERMELRSDENIPPTNAHQSENNPPSTTTNNTRPLQPTDNNGNGHNQTSAEQQHRDYYRSEISEPDNYYSQTREAENYYSQIREPESQTPALHVPSPNTGSQKEQDFPFDSPVLLFACIAFAFCAIPYHVFEMYVIIIEEDERVKGSPSLEYNLDTYGEVINLWLYWLFDLYHVIILILWMFSRVLNIFCYKLC